MTPLAYINHKGGTPSQTLSDRAMELWEWCKITVHAEHIPGQKTVETDTESWKAFGPERLDVEPGDFSSSGDEIGSIRCRPIHSKVQQTAEEIFETQKWKL